MLPGKGSCCTFIIFLIPFVVLEAAGTVKIRESAYAAFKVLKFLSHPRNLADNFERKDYTNIQIDVFIDALAADSALTNRIIQDFSRKNTLTVSSSSKVGGRVSSRVNGDVGSRLENLLLVYDSARRIDLEDLKTSFGNRWNPRAKVIAYIEKFDNNTLTAMEILAYFWKHDLLNVALTVQSKTSGLVENFIYNPFVLGVLSGSQGRVEKLKSNDIMFPDKLTNLHNHTIPISVFHHFPHAALTDYTILEKGADIEVLWALSKKLNFSVGLKTANVYGPSYTVRLANGEQAGMIGDVLVNRSDIVLNVQPMESTIGKRLEFTYPMLQTRYCVLVPKADVMPMILRMALPFPMEIWMAIIVAVVLLFICFTLMGERNKLLKIFDILLHQSLGNINIPKFTINRILLISYILWAYLIASIYQANFINELIVPKYYSDVDTLEELYDSNLPLFVGDNMVELLNNSDTPIFKQLATRSIENLVLNDCRNQLLAFFNVSCGADEYVGVLMAKEFTKNNNTFLIHMVKECLSLHWDVYVAKDGFPLLDKFNYVIQSLLEAGLYHKWVVDIVSMRRANIEEHSVEKLIMKHCEGSFGVLILGFGISIFAFITELATYRFSIRIANFFSRMKLK